LKGNPSQKASTSAIPEPSSADSRDGFWDRIHRLEAEFQNGLDSNAPKIAVNALLEIDRLVWQAHQDLESEEFISQAREKLRDMLVMVGQWRQLPADIPNASLTHLVQGMVNLRKRFRENGQWTEADALRELLNEAGIAIEDTPDGPRWRSEDIGDQDGRNHQGREP
jgi:cysteinyl-tRNA synthetase